MANKPLSIFEKTVDRADSLIALAATGPEIEESDDLIRSAVVIAVAVFDRYFTAKFCDVLVPHLKSGDKIGSNLFARLEKAGFDTEFALRLIADGVDNRTARPFRRIRNIVQTSLSSHTTHRDDAINDLFLDIGLKDLCTNAEKKAKKRRLVKQIMELVDIRNAIAHEAHVKLDGNPRAIDPEQIQKKMNALRVFVQSCDEIIDNRFGIKPALSA